jgi:hypothetical protein
MRKSLIESFRTCEWLLDRADARKSASGIDAKSLFALPQSFFSANPLAERAKSAIFPRDAPGSACAPIFPR